MTIIRPGHEEIGSGQGTRRGRIESPCRAQHSYIGEVVNDEGQTEVRRLVQRSKQTRAYDALSRWYGVLADPSEGPLRRKCLDRLRLQSSEAVLEIGSGPGADLPAVATWVGEGGAVCGLDLSREMLRACQRGLSRDRRGLSVRLVQGDGLQLPFRRNAFDVVVLSFTLELFGESEIPLVLQETARVMRGKGRIGVVSLSNRHPDELATRVYWWAHKALPGIIDCRPIDAPGILETHGYELIEEVERSMWGLRVTVLVAQKK
jgi:demethylmenaquinone methyltransferase/2-methoxy-6-polyprenyl-1,4-benzoquinol methylase